MQGCASGSSDGGKVTVRSAIREGAERILWRCRGAVGGGPEVDPQAFGLSCPSP